MFVNLKLIGNIHSVIIFKFFYWIVLKCSFILLTNNSLFLWNRKVWKIKGGWMYEKNFKVLQTDQAPKAGFQFQFQHCTSSWTGIQLTCLWSCMTNFKYSSPFKKFCFASIKTFIQNNFCVFLAGLCEYRDIYNPCNSIKLYFVHFIVFSCKYDWKRPHCSIHM